MERRTATRFLARPPPDIARAPLTAMGDTQSDSPCPQNLYLADHFQIQHKLARGGGELMPVDEPGEQHPCGLACAGNDQQIVILTEQHTLERGRTAPAVPQSPGGYPHPPGRGHHIAASSSQSCRDRGLDVHIHIQPQHYPACRARAATSLGCGVRWCRWCSACA
jgi:hypothetical protein